MKGLLIKDLLILKKYAYTILFVLLVGIIAGTKDISFIAGYIILFLSVIAMSTISYDEANHGLLTLFSLPISKSTYVKEKYLFSWIVTLAGFLFTLLLSVLNMDTFQDSFEAVFVILSTGILLLSFALPFQLKYGNEKGRIVLFVTIFFFIFLAIFLDEFLINWVNAFEKMIHQINPSVLSMILFLASMFVYWISMKISIHIYKNKQI